MFTARSEGERQGVKGPSRHVHVTPDTSHSPPPPPPVPPRSQHKTQTSRHEQSSWVLLKFSFALLFDACIKSHTLPMIEGGIYCMYRGNIVIKIHFAAKICAYFSSLYVPKQVFRSNRVRINEVPLHTNYETLCRHLMYVMANKLRNVLLLESTHSTLFVV